MLDKLQEIEEHYNEVLRLMAEPAVLSNQERYRELATEHRALTPVMEAYHQWREAHDSLVESRALLEEDDPELAEMAREEIVELEPKVAAIEEQLKLLLLPRDPNDAKNVILEIRAGTGGDEAALFAADLFRMYGRYADVQNWKIEILSSNETAIGGIKELICAIEGQDVYSHLKYESGVHRVQRVPLTETQGRIHTSACTVAILPEADEIDVQIAPNELRIDFYRSSGPGGQSVNTTDSACRATHIPTGLVVTCQDEKSQHKNRAKALKILRARLQEKTEAEAHAERAADRRSQVGTGDRSERIRTYNYPQNRLTDHRIGLTLYKLDQILLGQIDQVIDPLVTYYQAEALKSAEGR